MIRMVLLGLLIVAAAGILAAAIFILARVIAVILGIAFLATILWMAFKLALSR